MNERERVKKMATAKPARPTTSQGEKKEEPKPEPTFAQTLTVTPYGEDGEYNFDIWVTSNKGMGIKSSVRVAEGGVPKGPFPTDQNGYYFHQAAKFDEKERNFLVQVGPQLIYQVTLYGKQPVKAKKTKQQKKILRGQGFWANFNNARNRNRRKK